MNKIEIKVPMLGKEMTMEEKKMIKNCIQDLTDEYNIILAQIAEDCSFRAQVAFLDVKTDVKELKKLTEDLVCIKTKIDEWQKVLKE